MKEFFGLEQTFKLVFLCSYDLTAASCGPDGEGYDLIVDSNLARELLPAMRCAVFALKLANLASKVLFKVDVLGAVDSVVGGAVGSVSSSIEITPSSLLEDMEQWNGVGTGDWDMEAMMNSEEGMKELQMATGQTYRKLEAVLQTLDPGLTTLDMTIRADASQQCRWVKTCNVGKWSTSTEESRRRLMRLEEKNRQDKQQEKLLADPSTGFSSVEGDNSEEEKLALKQKEMKEYEDRIALLEKEVANQNRDMGMIDIHLEEQERLVRELKEKVKREEQLLIDAMNSVEMVNHDETDEEAMLRMEKEEYHRRAKEVVELEKLALLKAISSLQARNKSKEDLDKKKKDTMHAMDKHKEKLVEVKTVLVEVETEVAKVVTSMQLIVQGELEVHLIPTYL